MRFNKARTDFLEYLEIEQGRSQKTIANYDHYLTRLSDYAGEIEVSDIDGELIRKWRLWLNRLGTNVSDELGKSTLNCHHSCRHTRSGNFRITVQFWPTRKRARWSRP
jgi:site-specific recombinase XerD